MKQLLISIFSLFLLHTCTAQILKKVGDKIARDAEWRLRYKADQQVNRGLDSIIQVPQKIIDKKKGKKALQENRTIENNQPDNDTKKENKKTTDNNPAYPKDEGEKDMKATDGFITLQLSTNSIFTGGSILISGESIKYKKYTQVEITVIGTNGTDVKKITIANDGKYAAEWIAPDKTGEYTISAKSSDAKTSVSEILTVSEIELIFDDDWPGDNTRETKKAYDQLEDAVAKVDGSIGSKDKAVLASKMTELKGKIADVFKLFKDLNTAGKEISKLTKTGKKLSPNLAGNLSALNQNLDEHAKQVKKLSNMADHQPQDNTICEYLVMVNEACAAFSTFTNLWVKSLNAILQNITLDKGVPKVVDIINSKTTKVDAPHDFLMKEPAKIFATSLADAASLTTKLGKAGMGGDIIQYASDALLKTYCGVFKGAIKHDYSINFRNKDGVTWWKYGAEMQGALILRYPKDASKGNIIKMKGSLEGNATKFNFYENVEANDEFYDGSKGKIEVVELKVLKPATVPFVSSLSDQLGFGAVARGVTPASFYITVDAEYNVDAQNIKIFFNNALMDFTSLVNNQLIFLEIGADLFPYIKKMTFPIATVFSTLGSVVRSNNEFAVDKDAKGNLSFAKKANKHLGDKNAPIVHDLNFTIAGTKE